MRQHLTPPCGNSIERLCNKPSVDHMLSSEPVKGVELLRAWFAGHAYDKHRHDTYAIGLTDSGVQSFDYRGAKQTSTPRKVMVLHPDEIHNGRAGSDEGFGYRMLYVDPACISDAIRVIAGRSCPLPFVKCAVSENIILSQAVQLIANSSIHQDEHLAKDEIILRLTQGLIAGDSRANLLHKYYPIDFKAIALAREFIEAHNHRVIRSKELEIVTGLSRYDLTRQFRKALGTSPYRYSVNRRLDNARRMLLLHKPLVETAIATGFADQAHFSRLFKATYGVTPGHYSGLVQVNNH